MLDTDYHPEHVSPSCWIAPTATVLGSVSIGERSSVWFGAVIRGDTESIRIGQDSNIQDLCCLHADPGLPCTISSRVTLGHGAIVHGATVQENSLIGIRATVLNGAEIGRNSIIAAGAVVPEGKIIPANSLAMGVPAKVIRRVSEDDLKRIQHAADHYIAAAAKYRERFGNYQAR